MRPTLASMRPRVASSAPRRDRRASSARASPTAPVARTILGTMTFGWRYASEACDDDASARMLDAFARAGHDEIDTAIAYANGETERILGRVDAGRRARVDTKANPWPGGTMTPSAGRGGLGANELRAQVRRSVESLRGTKIRTLYLHAPDADTTLEEALRECERLRVEERAFEDVGLSNFSAWETVKAHELCEKYGWKRPTIYQGMYNALTRNVEAELVPALRATKMRFAAYNPLCGGLLTGKYKGNTDVGAVSGGRFAGNDMYQSRFWLPCYHEAVAEVVEACEKRGVAPADASLRWLYRHSALDGAEGDAVIVGASSAAQLEANLASAAREEPLHRDILDAFDAGWEKCRASAAPYFRGHCKIAR
jgi:aflatoxin B1 aldehyde reductase